MSLLRSEIRGIKLEIKESRVEKPKDVERIGRPMELFMTKRAANDHNANSAKG